MGGASRLEDLSADQLAWLATQEGFAGVLTEDAECVIWSRHVDFQPPSSSPDAARLRFEGGQLVEEGRDAPYVEWWTRGAEPPLDACWAASLRDEADGAACRIVRAGDRFMLARARPRPLPPDLRLADLARGAASLAELRSLVDCEISLGRVDAQGWRIERSTLPFREGRVLGVSASGARLRLRDGTAATSLQIEAMEGEPRA